MRRQQYKQCSICGVTKKLSFDDFAVIGKNYSYCNYCWRARRRNIIQREVKMIREEYRYAKEHGLV